MSLWYLPYGLQPYYGGCTDKRKTENALDAAAVMAKNAVKRAKNMENPKEP